jgi:hypothetical protein
MHKLWLVELKPTCTWNLFIEILKLVGGTSYSKDYYYINL